MKLVSLTMDPFVLMFLVVALGLALGQAKIGRFSLGNSGPLFVGLAVGWGVFRLSSHIIERGEVPTGMEMRSAYWKAASFIPIFSMWR